MKKKMGADLTHIGCIKSIDLNDLCTINFHTNASSKSSLVSLIQLPTVTHLDIYSFKGFPATALSGCSNLIDLQLRELELVPPEVNQVISVSKIPTPVSLYIRTKDCGLTARALAALLNSASLKSGSPTCGWGQPYSMTYTSPWHWGVYFLYFSFWIFNHSLKWCRMEHFVIFTSDIALNGIFCIIVQNKPHLPKKT